MTIEPGLYIHFKNNTHYRVVGEIWDADTGKARVLYLSVYGDYYVRDVDSWLEPAIDIAGNTVERYRRVGN